MRITNLIKLTLWIVGCNLAGAIGSLVTVSSISTWYAPLIKPALNPPSWIFAPVWTALYTLMGAAAFIIAQKHKETNVRAALGMFAVQLALNAVWTFIFFGAHNFTASFIEIVVLWFAILATIILFYRISRLAAALLIPYLLWVSFATYLAYSFWILN